MTTPNDLEQRDETPPERAGRPAAGEAVFTLLANVLAEMRNSLEEPGAGRPPRWVRIARGGARQGESSGAIGKIGEFVGKGVSVTLSLFPILQELALKLEDVLYQADAVAALGQVIFDGAAEIIAEENIEGINTYVLGDTQAKLDPDAMATARKVIADGKKILDYVPSPEDVWAIGHQLYRMLCIVQTRSQGDEIHIDVAESGKLRFCVWAYGRELALSGVEANKAIAAEDSEGGSGAGVDEARTSTGSLGARRLDDATLAPKVSMPWNTGSEDITLYSFDFADLAKADGKRTDIQELVALLQARGYGKGEGSPDLSGKTTIDEDFKQVLRQFQEINELPVTGEVDNHTLNRLLNLDFARKNVRRARPFDPSFTFTGVQGGFLELANPGGDEYEEDTVLEGRMYKYYKVSTSGKADTPRWIADTDPEATGRFVAISSRAARPLASAAEGRLDGGRWSEGVAASGRFFWAASQSEPGVAGRSQAGRPDSEADTPEPTPIKARMYQWIDLQDLPFESKHQVRIYVSVQQRSMFTDRGGTGFPDQGRIILELHEPPEGSDGIDFARVRPSKPYSEPVELELFPDHSGMPPVLDPEAVPIFGVDMSRRWFYRRSAELDVPQVAKTRKIAACLVVEGVSQSGPDIDAYFDDLRVGWVKVSTS